MKQLNSGKIILFQNKAELFYSYFHNKKSCQKMTA